MSNPFKYSKIVTGNDFCNRKKEQQDIKRTIENGEKIFIYSERRFGKTSLVMNIMNKLPKKIFVPIYIDLWAIDSEDKFITVLAKKITQAICSNAEKLLNTAKTFFSHLAPSITLDESGRPVVTFGINEIKKIEPELEYILSIPQNIAKKRNKKIVIIFDEFQQIIENHIDIIERKLRSIIQLQQDIAYIFLGSRKHIIRDMFLNRSRPLFRAAGHYPLNPIKTKDWESFIIKRFSQDNKQITSKEVEYICQLTNGHPFYTQHLCHIVWEQIEQGSRVTHSIIEEAVNMLLERENYAYTILWNSLTKNQKHFLTGIANANKIFKPYSSDFIRENKLKTASNAQRAAEALFMLDIIDHGNEAFIILDRFLKLWIKRIK